MIDTQKTIPAPNETRQPLALNYWVMPGVIDIETETIKQAIKAETGHGFEEYKKSGTKRRDKATVTDLRRLFVVLMRIYKKDITFTKLSKMLNVRDHSAVIYLNRTGKNFIEVDADFKDRFNRIKFNLDLINENKISRL